MNAKTYTRDALAVEVAMFAYMRAKTPRNVRLSDVLDKLQRGMWAKRIEALRKLLTEGDEETYHQRKKRLPSFYASGTAESTTNMLSHSGLIQSDLDGLGDRLGKRREALMKDPHVAAMFTSPSARGLKVLFHVATVRDADEHARAFAAMAAYFEEHYQETPDPSCKNWNRHCLVSHDPDLYRNPNAVAFEWKGISEEKSEERSLSVGCDLHSTAMSCISMPYVQGATGTAGAGVRADTSSASDEIALGVAARQFDKAFAAAQPSAFKLYDDTIRGRFKPKGEDRNKLVVDMATFLAHACGHAVMLRIAGHWYDLHRQKFKDTRTEHLKNADDHWKNVLGKYPGTLSAEERAMYAELADEDGLLQATFRICRDLARSLRPPPPPCFFMSWGELAGRFALPSNRGAGTLLTKLVDYGVIAVIQVHVLRVKGGPASRSTQYRWLLPME